MVEAPKGPRRDQMTDCPICREPSWANREGDSWNIHCGRCGRFRMSGSAHSMAQVEQELSSAGRQLLGPYGSRRRANASAWLRATGDPAYMVNSRNLANLASLATPTVPERMEALLREVGSESDRVGAGVDVGVDPWPPRIWALDIDEVIAIADLLAEAGLVADGNLADARHAVRLTNAGWARLSELGLDRSRSNRGFVAMWFRPSLVRLYAEAIDPAIRAAGYWPHRVDSEPHIDRIDDKIIADIRRSRFVVADYTGHRGGVYYETGFAHGLGLPVFFTCCKRDMKRLHFDIRQYNCIDWKNRSDLRERLEHAIVGVLGQGPLRGD